MNTVRVLSEEEYEKAKMATLSKPIDADWSQLYPNILGDYKTKLLGDGWTQAGPAQPGYDYQSDNTTYSQTQKLDVSVKVKPSVFEEAGHKLKKQIQSYLPTIFLDNEILGFVKSSPFFVIAGGCFTSIYDGENPNDFDVYILDNGASFRSSLKNFVLPKYRNSANKEKKSETSYMKNKNIEAVNTFFLPGTGNKLKVQFIETKYKSVSELIDDFDFNHCRISYTPYSDTLSMSKLTFDCMSKKILMQNKLSTRQVDQWRIDKFKKRGWNCDSLITAPSVFTWL
jgi:hypothetical protein